MMVKIFVPGEKAFIINTDYIKCIISNKMGSKLGYSVCFAEGGQHQITEAEFQEIWNELNRLNSIKKS